jgi:hypothetical protein
MKLCIFIPFHINLTFSGINKSSAATASSMQPRTEPAVGHLEVLPVVDQNLLDGGDQGLHLVVGGPVNISLRNAAQKIVLPINIK